MEKSRENLGNVDNSDQIGQHVSKGVDIVLNRPNVTNFPKQPKGGKVYIGSEFIEPMEKTLGYCLAGIIAGKFPGVQAIRKLANSWPSCPTISCHNNGLIYFRFTDRASMLRVYEGGPYSVYKRPLSLHLLNDAFDFQEALRRDVNTWVTLHDLPMDFWGEKTLGQITSSFGRPIMMDSTTFHKRILDFARVLVAIPVLSPPPKSVCVVCPQGKKHTIKLGYEFIPKFCNKCQKFGHYENKCTKDGTLPMGNQNRVVTIKPTQSETLIPQTTSDLQEARFKLRQVLESAKAMGISLYYTFEELSTMTIEVASLWLKDPTVQRIINDAKTCKSQENASINVGDVTSDATPIEGQVTSVPYQVGEEKKSGCIEGAIISVNSKKKLVGREYCSPLDVSNLESYFSDEEALHFEGINSPRDYTEESKERNLFVNPPTQEMIDIPINMAEDINLAVELGISPSAINNTKKLVARHKEKTIGISAYSHIKMSGYNHVEHTLSNILLAIYPSGEDWNARFHIIQELRSIVGSIESLRGATVEPFGSFVSDLFTKWGDLDISIELQNGSYISSPGKKHKQSLLVDVLRVLRKKGGFRRLQFIPSARVPILKFEGKFNISCDISINNLCGQMKSKILYWISGIDGRFRDLVLLVKEWAKTHHINDSKSGTLNSYCLSLLVLYHLQTLVPAILPPLKEIYPGNMSGDLTGVRAVAEKHIEDLCAVNIKRFRSDNSRPINHSSLSQLFISFLAKFSDICSRAATQGINPYMGQVEDINSNMRWLPKTYALFVEDPFEQPANVARTVSSTQFIKIADAIQITRQMLVSPNQNQASLVSVLVGPHLSWLGARTSVPNSTSKQYSSGMPVSRKGLETRPDRKLPRLQTQHKSQNKVHQKGEANGSKSASTSKNQQVWWARAESKAEKYRCDE